MSRHGYGSSEYVGAEDSLTDTLGYFASAIVDGVLDRSGFRDLEGQVHVIDDQRQLRMAFRNWLEPRRVSRGQEHDRQALLLRRGPEPVRRTALQKRALGAVKREPHAEHPGLLSPFGQERRRLRFLERDTAHHRKTAGIALDRL